MNIYLLITPVILSFLIFIFTVRLRYYYVLILSVFTIAATSFFSVPELVNGSHTDIKLVLILFDHFTTFSIDPLSAFFILVTNLTFFTGLLYSKGYLAPYILSKKPFEISIHYFSFFWLYLSMLGVLMFREGLPFLISWELMAVSSFILVLFEAEKRTTLKTAVSYLMQMHIGFFLLLTAFLICQVNTGIFGFDALPVFFSKHNNTGLFLLFFVGFGIKAGFVPFHTWLPDAHPAAPSHVSGVMSGVMIKMGIYGIIRVIMYQSADLYTTGLIILIVSAISGLFGVMMAIIQHDLKKLLAYHSIENIGIIGIGIGLGMIGLGLHNYVLAVFGFTGGILHVLNHSLFKSLLFYSSGSVYKKYHTLNIECLGGIIHKMPVTAFLFLTGALAICGLPPLNGFVSEFLIYIGLFKGLAAGMFYNSIFMILGLISLVLIGGLAIFCFTKAFSIVFLGTPRSRTPADTCEVEKSMLVPQILIVILIFLIGIFPFLYIQSLIHVVAGIFNIPPGNYLEGLPGTFPKITILGFVLMGITGILTYIRYSAMKKRKIERNAVWGCGYTASNEKLQYTGTSWATNFSELASPILQTKLEYRPVTEKEVFPADRTFNTRPVDIFRKGFGKMTDTLMMVLKYLARLQTGHIQHYIMYAFIFILLIFFLLYLNIL